MLTKSLHSGRKLLNRKLTYLFALFILISNLSLAQTNVSGGIYSNTTWTTAGSPYIVTDTIKVFPGVTLTIQPGGAIIRKKLMKI
jgi:hypothetical protein